MSIEAMFNELEFEIQSMAWPKNGKSPSVTPVVELLRDLRTEVLKRIPNEQVNALPDPDDAACYND